MRILGGTPGAPLVARGTRRPALRIIVGADDNPVTAAQSAEGTEPP